MRAYLIAGPDASARGSGGWDPAVLASGADAILPEAAGPGAWTGLADLIGTVRARAGAPRLWPRIAGLDDPGSEAALAALMPAAPDAIVLPVTHGRDVTHLSALLAVHEAEAGLPDGSTGIVAILDGVRAILDAASLVGASGRLRAIGWEAAPLAAVLGAQRSLDEAGWIAPLAQARASLRLAAAAAGAEAIESGLAAGDPQALMRAVAAARRDGFAGMFAHAPEQVAPIRGG